MKIYAIELLEDNDEETETLTRDNIVALLNDGYTHYYFPDWTLHEIFPVEFLSQKVVGLCLRTINFNRGVKWGWVAVMRADWKPADTHPDDPRRNR